MNKFILWLLAMTVSCLLYAQNTPAKQAEDLYALERVVKIEIDFKRTDWHGLLDSLKDSGDENRLVADVRVNGKLYTGAGVRYKGNSSYFNVRDNGYSKLPLNIKINHTDRNLRLPGGYTTLKLSNVFRDPSFVREVLAYEIASQYMPSPRANFAKVFANGQLLGLYNLSESVDDDLIAKLFGNDLGALFKCDPNWNLPVPDNCPVSDKASLQYLGQDSLCYMGLYEPKRSGDWPAFIELTRILKEKPNQIDGVLQVDEVLWMLAFNNAIVNLDSYSGQLCHNYYLYQDTFGIWHPVVWDMNLAFGGFRRTGNEPPLSNQQMQELSPFLHYVRPRNEGRPLVTVLLDNEHYRRIYLSHLRTILDEYLANGLYLQRAKAIQTLIAPEVKADSNRLYQLDAFQKNMTETVVLGNEPIIGIEELMSKRTAYLLQHPLLQKEAPVVQTPTVTKLASSLGIQVGVSGCLRTTLYYRQAANKPWQRVEMFDDGGHFDQMTGDGIFGVEIPLSPQLQYYIVAENQHLASLSPRRASKVFHVFKS